MEQRLKLALVNETPGTDLPLDAHPRMAGKGDMRRVAAYALGLSPDEVILEMGPWLGFLSRELAKYGQLHVVDNFVWTKDHDRRLPGQILPGQSFRGLYESYMARTGTDVKIHQADFSTFVWTGPEIAMLVIDSPKTARALQICLSAVADKLKTGAKVLIKNGLNTKHHEMMAYIERLAKDGHFRFASDNSTDSSNVLALEATTHPRRTRQALVDLLDPWARIAEPLALDVQPPAAFRMAALAQMVETGNWADAYKEVDALRPDPANIKLWDTVEHTIKTDAISPTDLALFSEVFHKHNTLDDGSVPEPIDISRGPIAAARAFWFNNADKPWRAEAFHPALLKQAAEFGYMSWPQRLRDYVVGRDVVDIGCGSGLHGLGYLCLGANSVLGVDPAIRTDRDRVKNLVTKSRKAFGWTPQEISKLVTPWQVLPVAFEDLDTEHGFDVAVLHDCVAHVDDVDGLVAQLAGQIRPGGHVVIRHKNFYCWNGHSQNPKSVSDIDPTDPDQAVLVDWNHLTFRAPSDHYVSSLNRVRLDDLTDAVSRHFDIEVLEESRSSPATGLGRLTPEIRRQFPNLTERDFLTQNIVCIARIS